MSNNDRSVSGVFSRTRHLTEFRWLLVATLGLVGIGAAIAVATFAASPSVQPVYEYSRAGFQQGSAFSRDPGVLPFDNTVKVGQVFKALNMKDPSKDSIPIYEQTTVRNGYRYFAYTRSTDYQGWEKTGPAFYVYLQAGTGLVPLSRCEDKYDPAYSFLVPGTDADTAKSCGSTQYTKVHLGFVQPVSNPVSASSSATVGTRSVLATKVSLPAKLQLANLREGAGTYSVTNDAGQLVTRAVGGANTYAKRVDYVAHNGQLRPMMILYPKTISAAKPLPLIVSLHGKGGSDLSCAINWENLPGKYNFAVACPAGDGRAVRDSSYGYPGNISDIGKIPGSIAGLIPGLTIHSGRVYVGGVSMGGQEALLAFSKNPQVFSGVIASDPLTDFWRRYDTSELSRQQTQLTEVGKPHNVENKALWTVRSPNSYIADITGGDQRPIFITCSTKDVVSCQDAQQVPAYVAQLKSKARANVLCRVNDTAHGFVWSDNLESLIIESGFVINGNRSSVPAILKKAC